MLLMFGLQIVSAGFKEGLIVFKITHSQGSGTMEFRASEKASRTLLKMTQMQMTINMDFLIKHDNPNIIYQINEDAKSYSVMDLSKLPQLKSGEGSKKDYKVTKLGEEKLLGYKTVHVMVEGENLKEEMWVSKEIDLYKVMKKIQSANQQSAGQLDAYKALEKKGMEGFPLKSISYHGKEKIVTEITKLEKKKFPKSIFNIPADYKKTEGMGNMLDMGSMQDLQNLQEMMQQNMTPEQIEQLNKMMEKAVPQQPQSK
jgi:hypothetical protein